MTGAATSDTRGGILAAALSAFAEDGTITVDAVRARSGASVGSIYHWFGGKDDIARALYVEALRDYQSGFLAAIRAADDDARAGVEGMVRHHLRWVRRNPDLARFLLAERQEADDLRELNRETLAATSEWLERQAGRIRPLSLDLVYAVVIGPSQEFARHWLAGRTRTSMKEAERILAEAAWNALAQRED